LKKTIRFAIIAIGILLLSGFTNHIIDDEPLYYVAIGWEEPSSTGDKTQPVVSNVVYVNCKYHSSGMVVHQLFEYYNAYYKQSRNALHLKQRVAWSYNTKDKAEKKRRELIAGFTNQGWEPFLIYRFSVLCDD
jgi:hypothetical protein